MLAYTLTLFLSGDFTRYWLHRLMHSVPFLWEFHKVHHSAEVLTPITFYRVHPVENLLFGLRYSLSAGLVTGVFLYFFGAGLALLDVLGVNLFVYIAHVVGDNLRHSRCTCVIRAGLSADLFHRPSISIITVLTVAGVTMAVCWQFGTGCSVAGVDLVSMTAIVSVSSMDTSFNP